MNAVYKIIFWFLRDCIRETKERLWPRRAEEEGSEAQAREAMEREERRRRAKERQQRLIEEFASMQKQFMEKAMETGMWKYFFFLEIFVC